MGRNTNSVQTYFKLVELSMMVTALVGESNYRQNYTLLEQKGVISSIIDEIIKLRKT